MFFKYLAYRFLHSLCAAVDCSLYDWPERLSDYEAEREVIEAQDELEVDASHSTMLPHQWPRLFDLPTSSAAPQ